MERRAKARGLMLVKSENEEREIDFEISYLRSLSARRRFSLMERKSREMRALLKKHGHGTAPSITKRK